MIKTVEVSAKRLEDAISEALKELGVGKDDADIEVLSQAGIFSKAKVRVSAEVVAPKEEKKTEPKKEEKKEEKKIEKVEKKAEPKKVEKPKFEKKHDSRPSRESRSNSLDNDRGGEGLNPKGSNKKPADKPAREREPLSEEESAERQEKAKKFLEGVLSRMGVTAGIDMKVEGDRLTIDLAANDNALIGSRGETLSALRYLTSLVVNAGGGKYAYVDLDSGDYRVRRTETLQRLAVKTADRAIRAGRKVRLEPMPSGDRRIIHTALQDRTDIVCRSEGKEPRRAIAIMPAGRN